MRLVPALALLVAAPATTAAPSMTFPGARGQGARTTIESWNISYAIPSAWQVSQRAGRVHTLLQGAGMQVPVIYVGAGMYQSFNDVAVDLNKGFNLLGLGGMPMSQPEASTVRGMQAMAVSYVAQNQMGMQFQARAFAVLTAHGTGLVVLGIAPAGQLAQIQAAVDQLAQSVEAGGPPQANQQAVAALRGRWMYYAGKADGVTSASGGASRSHEEFVEFDGQGRFAYQSSTSVSVTTPGLTGYAGNAQSSNDEGTYTVIGSTLVVRGRHGQASFDLQFQGDRIISDGRTWVRAN